MEEFKFTFVARNSVEERTLSLSRVIHGINTGVSVFSQRVPIASVVRFMNAFLSGIFADSPQFKLCPEKGGYAKFFSRVG